MYASISLKYFHVQCPKSVFIYNFKADIVTYQKSPTILPSRIFCELAVLKNAQDRKYIKILVTPSTLKL